MNTGTGSFEAVSKLSTIKYFCSFIQIIQRSPGTDKPGAYGTVSLSLFVVVLVKNY
jgi:hypothetical protein